MDIQWPVNISCEELLKEQCTYCGWLRKERKVKFLPFAGSKGGQKMYCVLSDRCFYYFKNDDSKHPSGKFHLYGYNKVVRNVDENVKWSFILEHIQPEQKSYIFSASSQQEMVEWMKYIKQEMLRANNRGPRTTADGSSDDSLRSYELQKIEEKIYDDITSYKPVYVAPTPPSDSDSDSEDTEMEKQKSKEPPPRFTIPDMPRRIPAEGQPASRRAAYEHVDTIAVTPAHIPSIPERQPEKDYWKKIYFNGDKDEAAKIIEDIAKDGVFLVRNSDSPTYPKVLVTYSENQQKVKLFRIFINQEKTMYYLREDNMFETIEELIYYYYHNSISTKETFKLTVPYLLSN